MAIRVVIKGSYSTSKTMNRLIMSLLYHLVFNNMTSDHAQDIF